MGNVTNMIEPVALLLDGNRGVYIPKNFVEDFDLTAWEGIDAEDVAICKDPDHEHYWDAWCQITDHATFTKHGETWTLYQDGDLWALCFERMSAEEKENFGFDQ
jgi:hypothetical protein